jgi:hypothetical protein
LCFTLHRQHQFSVKQHKMDVAMLDEWMRHNSVILCWMNLETCFWSSLKDILSTSHAQHGDSQFRERPDRMHCLWLTSK